MATAYRRGIEESNWTDQHWVYVTLFNYLTPIVLLSASVSGTRSYGWVVWYSEMRRLPQETKWD